jgi:hypothetical protein
MLWMYKQEFLLGEGISWARHGTISLWIFYGVCIRKRSKIPRGVDIYNPKPSPAFSSSSILLCACVCVEFFQDIVYCAKLYWSFSLPYLYITITWSEVICDKPITSFFCYRSCACSIEWSEMWGFLVMDLFSVILSSQYSATLWAKIPEKRAKWTPPRSCPMTSLVQ